MVLALRIAHLRFGYGASVPLLNDVSFDVTWGDVFCLLGPNGSGKTTLLRCVLGLLRTAPGVIQVGGRDLTGLTARGVAREWAYVPQGITTILPHTAFEVVLMLWLARGRLTAGTLWPSWSNWALPL